MTPRNQAICSKSLASRVQARRADSARRGRMGAAARERNRMARVAAWELVRVAVWTDPRNEATHEWRISVAPDGRHVALEADGRTAIAGSVRTLTAAVGRALWRAK